MGASTLLGGLAVCAASVQQIGQFCFLLLILAILRACCSLLEQANPLSINILLVNGSSVHCDLSTCRCLSLAMFQLRFEANLF